MTPLKKTLIGSASAIAYGALVWTFSASPPPPSGDGELTIVADFGEVNGSGNPIGPCVVWFDITGYSGFNSVGPQGTVPYDERLHRIHVFWDFGDEGSTAHSNINLPTVWRNTNIAKGHRVLHHYTPGTYTWSAFAVEEDTGITATASGTITVADGVSHYTGPRTICLSLESNFTGAPSGSDNVSTVSAANASMQARATAGETFRLLLRRGETYATPALTIPSNAVNFRLDTYGTGDRPIINGSLTQRVVSSIPAPVTHFYAANLDCRGGWDVTKERGIRHVTPFDIRTGRGHVDFFNVKIGGYPAVINAAEPNGSTQTRTALVNLWGASYQDFGMFTDNFGPANDYLGMVGTTIANPSGTVEGNYGRTVYRGSIHNAGGSTGWGIRIEGHQNVIMQQCDFANLFGYLGFTGFLGHQPPLRANTDGLAGVYYNIAYSSFEGGTACIGTLNSSNNIQELQRGVNFIVENCLFCFTRSTTRALDGNVGGVTLRNNIALQFAGTHLVFLSQFISIGNTSASADNLACPVRLYNNTFYTLTTNAQNGGGASALAFLSDFTFVNANNIVAAPNQVSVGDLDYTATLAGFVPRNTGVTIGFNAIPQDISTTADSASFTVAYPAGTNQAYWQALVGIDDSHMVRLSGGTVYYYELGQINVAFGASNITITNTSGVTWSAQAVDVKLDRASQHVLDTTLGSPQSAPAYPRPVDSGWVATGVPKPPRDAFGTTRGDTWTQGFVEEA
jgi:hypothetical protein